MRERERGGFMLKLHIESELKHLALMCGPVARGGAGVKRSSALVFPRNTEIGGNT